MPTPTRLLAHRILLETERRGPTLADRLASPDVDALAPRDRALLHELVLGTLRRRGPIDLALSRLSRRPLDRVDPAVLAALRLGADQILFLRVPDRAAVSESVALVSGAAARGFVNAILRRLAREGPPPETDAEADPAGWLTTTGSLPPWLAERWLARLGPARALARARAFLEPPIAAFRLNPRVPDARARVEEAGLAARPLAIPGAWEATAGRPAELAASGLVYLQDPASQLVARLAAGGRLTLDACAAPGGKATLVADESGPTARVVAAEASPRRLSTLARLCRRWGADNVSIVGADARRPPFRNGFDTVLLDAPCSGLGTIGRHPDLRWRARPDDPARHATRQREMLEALAPQVRRGGRLVYAACSLEPEETEGVVSDFLAAHPEMAPAPVPEWAAAFADGPYVRTLPERDHTDGFFAAVLERD
jgi:16S rRNA (cytosine967-C5)-methyltransferase